MNSESLTDGQRPLEWRLDVTLRETTEIGAVVAAVSDAMIAAGYSSEDIFGMRLILDEAICNAIKHGNRHDPTKKVHVRCHVAFDRVESEIEDEGEGFDPRLVPDPLTVENRERTSGRGLLLMRRYATQVSFSERGNRVAVTRHRARA
ncbi:MAG TPA: ATP-binding protein [Gemmataceae bacterium]